MPVGQKKGDGNVHRGKGHETGTITGGLISSGAAAITVVGPKEGVACKLTGGAACSVVPRLASLTSFAWCTFVVAEECLMVVAEVEWWCLEVVEVVVALATLTFTTTGVL